jgi:large subunit ribosomal protein L34e
MVQRVTLRRRHSYATRSNHQRKVKTPGGKLVVQTITKKANPIICGDCGSKLQGIPVCRPYTYHLMSKREKKVTRSYGGSRCAHCVRERIIRAFLIEEQKIVKRVLKAQVNLYYI